ncbi:PREDICTED: plectin [Aptenodytes forsteri]|uniref:plectin n=1 Tax=Aptenodytes forsteri TaxID=9233 RepID=UPI000904B43A|nr:PREDICTED: plectin [Aptenodytes forsteri]
MQVEECRQVLRSLETHYQEFLRDSQDSQSFQPDDRLHVEREYNACTQKYELLLRSQEKGEQDESLCKNYISQLKDIRLQLEGCETRTIHKIRLPLDKDPIKECAQRITEQQQIHLELEGIKKNLDKVSEKTEKVLAQPEQASSAPVLRSELEITLQKMDQVYSLSSIYLEKLKTINLVIRSTQGAEELVKKYEDQLKDVQTVPADLKELEASKAELKRLRAQAEGHQPFFSTLETDLSKAKDVNERMVRGHSERDVDLDRYRERVQQLLERWQAPDPDKDLKTVREQLLQEKKLLEECDRNKEKVEECQRYAKQYIDAIKVRPLAVPAGSGLASPGGAGAGMGLGKGSPVLGGPEGKRGVEPVASPAKKPKVQSASDSIIQEYVDLRTRYSEPTTLTSQHNKVITETLRRLEEEEGSGMRARGVA